MVLQNIFCLVQFFQWKIYFAQLGLLDHLHPFQIREYESYFYTADGAFRNGQVVATKKGRKKCWRNWSTSIQPLIVEPWLQDASYQQIFRLLTGFTAYVRSGNFVRGKQVTVVTVPGALSALVVKIALAYEVNPNKDQGGK